MARNVSTGGLKVMAIRREDQSLWERRAPLGPQHVRKLVKEGVKVIVQPSNRRCYPMQVIFKFLSFVTRFLMISWQFIQAYANAGAIIKEDLSEASVIFGVKQVPIDSLQRDKTFVFFSHTIKVKPKILRKNPSNHNGFAPLIFMTLHFHEFFFKFSLGSTR